MQKYAVEWIHRVLGDLQPVAGRVNQIRSDFVIRLIHRIEHWKWRAFRARAHISEYQSAVLAQRIGAMKNVTGNSAGRWLTRCFKNGPIAVVEPSVIAATDSRLFYYPKLKRGAAMAAMRVQQAQLPAAIAVQHQFLIENAQGNGEVLNLRGHGNGQPESPEVLSRRRPRANLVQNLVHMWLVRGCPMRDVLFDHR